MRSQRQLGKTKKKRRRKGEKGSSWWGCPTAIESSQNTSQNILKETILKPETMMKSDSTVSVLPVLRVGWELGRIQKHICYHYEEASQNAL